MNEMNEDSYMLDLNIADIYLLYDCVCKRIETWPGGNPEEQEHLFALKDWLYRCVLDYKFHEM